jgi:Dyp-type peroxidase family
LADAARVGLLGEAPEHNRVAPGEFLLGYSNEFDELPASPLVPNEHDPAQRLAPHRTHRELRDLGRDGSYFVLRQLAQDVHGFWAALVAQTTTAAERDLLAAKMVGRWPSGAPLVLSPDRDRPELATADTFGYASEDPAGLRCPFGAHIRRANPRDWRVAPEARRATAISNQHRLIRRSRPYGPPLAGSFSPDDVLRAGDDGIQRGLLFSCFAVDLARQYELIQEAWLNDSSFFRLRDQCDPLLGSAEGPNRFSVPAQPLARHYQGMPSAVRVRGGAYFFLPSLPALEFIAGLGG